jgi:hypothetical protein
LSATIFFEIDAARLALDFAELFMAALGAIHTILGATASEKEAETIVSMPRNLCDEPHDAALVNAAKTGLLFNGADETNRRPYWRCGDRRLTP